MNDIIRVTCSACGAQIKARVEVAGQVRKCPACSLLFVVPLLDGPGQTPFGEKVIERKAPSGEGVSGGDRIREPEVSSSQTDLSDSGSENADISTSLAPPSHPHHLNRENGYVLLDSQRMTAFWKADKGWQLLSGGGMVSAKRNPDMLPKQGDFKLVELIMQEKTSGLKLVGLRFFQLARQYAVSKLSGEENAILGMIIGHAKLTRAQKVVLLQSLKTLYMRDVWADSPTVYQYLTGEELMVEEVHEP